MTMVKMSVAFVVATVLCAFLGVQTAVAGTTVMEKDYVGNVENLNRIGGGEPGREAIPGVAARFAESVNTIAEGPPPGASEPTCVPSDQDPAGNNCAQDYIDVPERLFDDPLERFVVSGDATRLGSSSNSVNGYATWETNPRCVGSGFVEPGGQSIHSWTFAIERPPVTDFQVQICLDVRKCQVNEDNLGQASTPADVGLFFGNDYIAPVVIRASHQSGDLWIPGTAPWDTPRVVDDIRIPSLTDVRYPTGRLSPLLAESYQDTGLVQLPLIPDLPSSIESGDDLVSVGVNGERVKVSRLLDESIAFIGKDCTTKWIRNDGMFRAHDLIKIELSVPSSIDVRVRTAQDSAALCYIGSLIPGGF